jgi:hypothetical protein
VGRTTCLNDPRLRQQSRDSRNTTGSWTGNQRLANLHDHITLQTPKDAKLAQRCSSTTHVQIGFNIAQETKGSIISEKDLLQNALSSFETWQHYTSHKRGSSNNIEKYQQTALLKNPSKIIHQYHINTMCWGTTHKFSGTENRLSRLLPQTTNLPAEVRATVRSLPQHTPTAGSILTGVSH